MATGTSEYKMQVEGPEDWAKWKWHVSILLRAHALEDIVDGTRRCPELAVNADTTIQQAHHQWLKDDAKAASLLASTLGKTVAELVLICNRASEI